MYIPPADQEKKPGKKISYQKVEKNYKKKTKHLNTRTKIIITYSYKDIDTN